ncbi:MAG: hypothetical protein ACLRFH_00970 [Opitutales bacterium]
MFILNKEIVRKIFSRSIAKVVAILSLTSLVQAAQFHLPPGTPGLQHENAQSPLNPFMDCVHIHIPNTTCHLYFPIDGSQPTTTEAGQYSGARFVGQLGDDLVTDWWVRVFGGNRAVNWSRPDDQQLLNQPPDIPMGFDINGNIAHIINVKHLSLCAGWNSLRISFWQAFRQIAADPVGRVLLYRLLIEIRRVDSDTSTQGCEEKGDRDNDEIIRDDDINKKCRSIKINQAIEGCCFKIGDNGAQIDFEDLNRGTFVFYFVKNHGTLLTKNQDRPVDVALFHEMLHWFHYLRRLQRVLENKSGKPDSFKYVLRCYYGNQTELCVWGLICNVEEIATILGSPNHNNQEFIRLMHEDAFLLAGNPNLINNPNFIMVNINGVPQYIPYSERFLNGDDLSENAYRASKDLPIRYGHVNTSISSYNIFNIPSRFILAHRVAFYCYYEVTGQILRMWNFGPGEAIAM